MSEFVPFRFKVNLYNSENNQLLCSGQFSEVTGFELSMEPNAIREGAPMILKRGVTSINDLWSWFDASTRGSHYGYRLHGEIVVLGNPIEGKTENPVMTWRLEGVMATKFKGPDLNATASQVAIEELHLVHEGLELERSATADNGSGS